MDRSITPGSIWRHFKGTHAKIITLAKHSETGEELVIYTCSGNEGKTEHEDGVYARPKEMFLSEVDHEKYPDVKQKYRLEKVSNTLASELSKLYPDVKPRAGFIVGYVELLSKRVYRPLLILVPASDPRPIQNCLNDFDANCIMEAYRNYMKSESDVGLYLRHSQLFLVAKGEYWQFDTGSIFVNDNTTHYDDQIIDYSRRTKDLITEAMHHESVEI